MLLYLGLFVASFAMLAVVMLTFFTRRLRNLLKAHLYHRVYSFFAVLAVAGILIAGLAGMGRHDSPARTSMASYMVK